MYDKAIVFDIVSARMLSLALKSDTPRRQSLSWNWVLLRETHAATVESACEQFQGRPLSALR